MRKAILKSDKEVLVAWWKVFWITGSFSSRWQLVLLFVYTFFKRLLGWKRFKQTFGLELNSKSGSAKIVVRDMADITTVAAIFVEGEYELDIKDSEVESIVDLGANIGVSVAYFRLRYPHAYIYAVEADPDTYRRLEQNCRSMDKVTLINAAIAPKTGPIIFHSSESSVSGSIYSRAHGAGDVEVRGVTIDDLVREQGIEKVSILKFDIEGAEFDAFPASPNVVSSTKAIIGEVHPDIGNRSGGEFLNLFASMRVKVIPREKNRFILKAYKL